MELRIVVFVAVVALGVMLNTALVFAAYKAFSALTSKVTTTVSEFGKNNEIRQWVASMQTAGEQAVSVTAMTKQRLAELEPVIARAQDSYSRSLAEADDKLQEVANQIDSSAQKVRDAVAKPAVSTMAFVAGLTKALEAIQRDE